MLYGQFHISGGPRARRPRAASSMAARAFAMFSDLSSPTGSCRSATFTLDGRDEPPRRSTGGARGAGRLAPADDDDDDDADGGANDDDGVRRAVTRSRPRRRDASLPHPRWDTARSPSDAANAAAVIGAPRIGGRRTQCRADVRCAVNIKKSAFGSVQPSQTARGGSGLDFWTLLTVC